MAENFFFGGGPVSSSAARRTGVRKSRTGRMVRNGRNVRLLVRRVVDGEISPTDAVKAYHEVLQRTGIKPQRSLQQDLQLTTNKMSYR